jgi:hypothetical protein
MLLSRITLLQGIPPPLVLYVNVKLIINPKQSRAHLKYYAVAPLLFFFALQMGGAVYLLLASNVNVLLESNTFMSNSAGDVSFYQAVLHLEILVPTHNETCSLFFTVRWSSVRV